MPKIVGIKKKKAMRQVRIDPKGGGTIKVAKEIHKRMHMKI